MTKQHNRTIEKKENNLPWKLQPNPDKKLSKEVQWQRNVARTGNDYALQM